MENLTRLPQAISSAGSLRSSIPLIVLAPFTTVQFGDIWNRCTLGREFFNRLDSAVTRYSQRLFDGDKGRFCVYMKSDIHGHYSVDLLYCLEVGQ